MTVGAFYLLPFTFYLLPSMPVLISSDYHKSLPFCLDQLRETGEKLLLFLDHQESELSILLTDDDGIAQLNQQYRQKAKATNVLSFPLAIDEDIINGTMLGDIVISIDTSAREAEVRGITIIERTSRLLIHGLIHLLGHDHERSEQAALMMLAAEEKLIKELGIAPDNGHYDL